MMHSQLGSSDLYIIYMQHLRNIDNYCIVENFGGRKLWWIQAQPLAFQILVDKTLNGEFVANCKIRQSFPPAKIFCYVVPHSPLVLRFLEYWIILVNYCHVKTNTKSLI